MDYKKYSNISTAQDMIEIIREGRMSRNSAIVN